MLTQKSSQQAFDCLHNANKSWKLPMGKDQHKLPQAGN